MAGEAVQISRLLWAHGEAACPSCGLPLDPAKDLREYIHVADGGTVPVAAIVKHMRCGWTGTIHFIELPR